LTTSALVEFAGLRADHGQRGPWLPDGEGFHRRCLPSAYPGPKASLFLTPARRIIY